MTDLEAAAAALIVLARFNVPTDTQELLVFGNPDRGVPPGALSAAIKAVLKSYRSLPSTKDSDHG